ncbi:hypothetical protein FOZ61_008198 [Perkinsus olseni]|uniref:Uncharacterized protein n=1 Tax=Perkinsus olseni TaxID=32597 RepID=A0A7J6L5Q3_PEROL|nr:hypothetical protein FOZ61_008198 [Perkinsus olseni]
MGALFSDEHESTIETVVANETTEVSEPDHGGIVLDRRYRGLVAAEGDEEGVLPIQKTITLLTKKLVAVWARNALE